MTSDDLSLDLTEIFSKKKVLSDLHMALSNSDNTIYLDKQTIKFDDSIGIEFIYRRIVDDYAGVFFGRYKIALSVGKYSIDSYNYITSEFCFAILHYDEKFDLLEIDFRESLY